MNETIQRLSITAEKFSWLAFALLWALMIAFFISVALYAPGAVAWFNRYIIAATIFFGGGAMGVHTVRFLRSATKMTRIEKFGEYTVVYHVIWRGF